jgi:hypothetical protein
MMQAFTYNPIWHQKCPQPLPARFRIVYKGPHPKDSSTIPFDLAMLLHSLSTVLYDRPFTHPYYSKVLLLCWRSLLRLSGHNGLLDSIFLPHNDLTLPRAWHVTVFFVVLLWMQQSSESLATHHLEITRRLI